MQTEQQNSIGAIKAAGSIGRVSPALITLHTYATSTLPTVPGAPPTAWWVDLTTALGVLVTNFLMRCLEFYCLRASDLLKLR